LFVSAALSAAISNSVTAQTATNRQSRPSARAPWPTTGGKLQELEKKAAERDVLADTCKSLESEVQRLRGALAELEGRQSLMGSSRTPSRLETLEARAEKFADLSTQLEYKEVRITQLQGQLDAQQETKRTMEDEISVLRSQIDALTTLTTEQAKQLAAMRSNVDEILLGKYEYYEVKEGDTLASIAAQPLVYGDEARKAWIRQTNARRVEDMDNLRVGEVLIIPRFPPSGRYAF